MIFVRVDLLLDTDNDDRMAIIHNTLIVHDNTLMTSVGHNHLCILLNAMVSDII